MTDDLQCRELRASLAARLPALNDDELRLIDRVVQRIAARRARGYEVDLSAPHGIPYFGDEPIDAGLAALAETIMLEDQHRAGLRETAAVEMVGAVSIMDADPVLKAKALDQMEQECRRLTIESERSCAVPTEPLAQLVAFIGQALPGEPTTGAVDDPEAEFAPDQQLTRLDSTPEVIALCEQPRDRDEELEVDLQFDTSDVEEPIGVHGPGGDP